MEKVVVLQSVAPDRYRLVLRGGGEHAVLLLTYQAVLALARELAKLLGDEGFFGADLPKRGV